MLSTHYYVLSLGPTRAELYEAFRDSLNEVQNQGFPIVQRSRGPDVTEPERLELARAADRCFGRYYETDPLRLIVVGDDAMQSAFGSVTLHRHAVLGRIDGNGLATTARDLGRIVWPLVRDAMSGMPSGALPEIEILLTAREHVAAGLEAVARIATRGDPFTLLVEDHYHQRGSIANGIGAFVVSPEVDVRNAVDDAVDAVIDRVLARGGNVIFTPPGTLANVGRILLLRRVGEEIG